MQPHVELLLTQLHLEEDGTSGSSVPWNSHHVKSVGKKKRNHASTPRTFFSPSLFAVDISGSHLLK